MGTSITSPQIRDLTIDTVDLADAAVTETKLAAGAVTTAKIADEAVTNAKLAGSISTDKLAEGSLFFKDGDTITIQDGSVVSTEEQLVVETTVEAVTVDDPEPTVATEGVAVDGYVRWALLNTSFSVAVFQGWGYIDGFGWVKLKDVVGQIANGSSLSGIADVRGASRFYMQVTEAVASSEAHMLSGVVFQRSSASQVSLVPSGVDGNARVPVSSGANLVQVLLSTTLVADITSAGANGLDTGSEASSTGYDVRVITEGGGANPALLLTATGAAPTLPGTYTHQSDVLWFIYNNSSSDIEPFHDAGQGWCTYNETFKGISVLSSGTATSITAIDLSEIIPDAAVETRIHYSADYTGAGAAGDGAFLYNSTDDNLVDIVNITDNPDEETFVVAVDAGPTTSLKYQVSATDVNLDVRVIGWKLRRN